MTSQAMDRREFLKFSAAAFAALGLGGCAGFSPVPRAYRRGRLISENQSIRIAQIGFGGKGSSDVKALSEAGAEVVALCDIDWSQKKVKETVAAFPNAKQFYDFRQMLIEMDDEIDAVVVSTPDHMHFLPAFMAICMGKHVYVQKPLTQTIAEARALREAARLHRVQTQMGNQGHAGEGTRLLREWVQAGVIGPVREVIIWTDRPVWPQGISERPDPDEEPADLRWDLFLGRAPDRPFSKAYHPFKWRGWWDFGCGALGDMGCHVMDASYYALDLGQPVWVEAETTDFNDREGFPKSSLVTYAFPHRGRMPPVLLKWYDGGRLPERPNELEPDRKFPKGGQLIIGDRGKIMDGSDYCTSPRLIPESAMQAADLPPKTIPRVPNGSPYVEWLQAIRTGRPAGSNFEYSAGLTEMVLLGNLAIRARRRIYWDPKRMRVTNCREANDWIHPNYRRGWEPEKITIARPTLKQIKYV